MNGLVGGPSLLLALLIFITSASLFLSTSSWIVKSLPGFDGPLPFHLETGYIRVDEERDAQLFYYFIKSERSPDEDPLLVWITGGPGCSVFSAVAYEIGPLHFDVKKYKGELPTLVLHPYSWTKVSNILFIDSPIGSGFSFARGPEVYYVGDVKSSKQVAKFITKWLDDHPQFFSNPLYIGGDSYGGKVVPIITLELVKDIDAGKQPLLNLKGYLIGNPLTDARFDDNSFVPYSFGMGLISKELYMSAKKSCRGQYAKPKNAQCARDVGAIKECISGLNQAHILEPKCEISSPHPRQRRSLVDQSLELMSPLLIPDIKCPNYGFVLSNFWANNDTVREALHIQMNTVEEWVRCDYDVPYVQDISSSIPYHHILTTRGYRALVYSGDHDLSISHVGTQAWIKTLNFSTVDDWRPWSVDGQVAGYTRSFANNLTFALVKGGGHISPENRPKESYNMFERWIAHNPL